MSKRTPGTNMPNFQNEERLVKVLRTLAERRNECKAFYRALLDLQADNDDDYHLLRNVFASSVSDRRGASLQRGQQAVADFDDKAGDLLRTLAQEMDDDPEGAHLHLFEGLCKLRNIDQKIAALTIKLMVVYLGRWQELTPFLFVPVDRVVLKMLRNKLHVYSGPWKQAPSTNNARYVYDGRRPCAQYERFIEFQEELGHICSKAGVPRILADELWFVGHVFCKELPLCNRCWIKLWCQDSDIGLE